MRPKNKIWKNFTLVEKVTWIMLWDDVDMNNFEASKPIARKIIETVKRHLTKRVPDVAKSGEGKSKISGKRPAKPPRR